MLTGPTESQGRLRPAAPRQVHGNSAIGSRCGDSRSTNGMSERLVWTESGWKQRWALCSKEAVASLPSKTWSVSTSSQRAQKLCPSKTPRHGAGPNATRPPPHLVVPRHTATRHHASVLIVLCELACAGAAGSMQRRHWVHGVGIWHLPGVDPKLSCSARGAVSEGPLVVAWLEARA